MTLFQLILVNNSYYSYCSDFTKDIICSNSLEKVSLNLQNFYLDKAKLEVWMVLKFLFKFICKIIHLMENIVLIFCLLYFFDIQDNDALAIDFRAAVLDYLPKLFASFLEGEMWVLYLTLSTNLICICVGDSLNIKHWKLNVRAWITITMLGNRWELVTVRASLNHREGVPGQIVMGGIDYLLYTISK